MAIRGGQDGSNGAASPEGYEKQLSVALRRARTIASLYAISRFVACCNLIWASLVILGAFASYLLPLDFTFIACLVLLEAARLLSISFLTGIAPRARTPLSQDPKLIIHGKDGRWPTEHYARICSQLVQFLLIVPSLVIPSLRMLTMSVNYDANMRNLQNSLRVFYVGVTLNALIVLLNLAYTPAALSLSNAPDQSIVRYYDKALDNALRLGIARADDFEFFRFSYMMLASEYRRNVQPEAVAKNNRNLIKYLYTHRLGVDSVQLYMDAKDAFVQLAAVNMVGYWVDTVWGVGLEAVKLPEELLTKLADKVGTGQVGWAAVCSLGALARTPGGACVVARTRSSSGRRVAERLAELVDETSSRSLALVRTLGSFFEQLCVQEKEKVAPRPFNEEVETELVEKLKKLARGAKVQRLRVQAAYLLLVMGLSCEPRVIEAVDPTQDSYWFQSEVSMLRLLRQHIPYHVAPLHLHDLAIRQDSNITPPAWAHPPVDT